MDFAFYTNPHNMEGYFSFPRLPEVDEVDDRSNDQSQLPPTSFDPNPHVNTRSNTTRHHRRAKSQLIGQESVGPSTTTHHVGAGSEHHRVSRRNSTGAQGAHRHAYQDLINEHGSMEAALRIHSEEIVQQSKFSGIIPKIVITPPQEDIERMFSGMDQTTRVKITQEQTREEEEIMMKLKALRLAAETAPDDEEQDEVFDMDME